MSTLSVGGGCYECSTNHSNSQEYGPPCLCTCDCHGTAEPSNTVHADSSYIIKPRSWFGWIMTILIGIVIVAILSGIVFVIYLTFKTFGGGAGICAILVLFLLPFLSGDR